MTTPKHDLINLNEENHPCPIPEKIPRLEAPTDTRITSNSSPTTYDKFGNDGDFYDAIKNLLPGVGDNYAEVENINSCTTTSNNSFLEEGSNVSANQVVLEGIMYTASTSPGTFDDLLEFINNDKSSGDTTQSHLKVLPTVPVSHPSGPMSCCHELLKNYIMDDATLHRIKNFLWYDLQSFIASRCGESDVNCSKQLIHLVEQKDLREFFKILGKIFIRIDIENDQKPVAQTSSTIMKRGPEGEEDLTKTMKTLLAADIVLPSFTGIGKGNTDACDDGTNTAAYQCSSSSAEYNRGNTINANNLQVLNVIKKVISFAIQPTDDTYYTKIGDLIPILFQNIRDCMGDPCKTISTGAKVLFDGLFTQQEILMGNLKGRRSAKVNSDKVTQLDVVKINLITRFLSWMLSNPSATSRNIHKFVEFDKKLLETDRFGLSRPNLSYFRSVIAKHASYRRTKLSKKPDVQEGGTATMDKKQS